VTKPNGRKGKMKALKMARKGEGRKMRGTRKCKKPKSSN